MAFVEDSRRRMMNAPESMQVSPLGAWIASDLARRYDSALLEPLPPDLLDLLSDQWPAT